MTDDAIREHLPLVSTIASEVHQKYGHLRPGPDLDDLISYGCAGLLEAAGRFDANRNASFSTFAYYRIRGAMLDGIRKMGRFSRAQVAQHRAPLPTEDARPSDRQRSSDGTSFDDLDERLHATHAVAVVRELLDSLSVQSRDLLRAYFYDGRTLLEIGEETGLSKSWTSRLLTRALGELREKVLREHPDLVSGKDRGLAPSLRGLGIAVYSESPRPSVR